MTDLYDQVETYPNALIDHDIDMEREQGMMAERIAELKNLLNNSRELSNQFE